MLQTELLINAHALLFAILDIAADPKGMHEAIALDLWVFNVAPHLPCTDEDARRLLHRCYTAAKLAKLRVVAEALRDWKSTPASV